MPSGGAVSHFFGEWRFAFVSAHGRERSNHRTIVDQRLNHDQANWQHQYSTGLGLQTHESVSNLQPWASVSGQCASFVDGMSFDIGHKSGWWCASIRWPRTLLEHELREQDVSGLIQPNLEMSKRIYHAQSIETGAGRHGWRSFKAGRKICVCCA